MVRRELGGHGPAQGVAGDVPVLDVRKLLHHVLRRVRIEDGQMEGHLHQDAGEAGLPQLVQQGQIGGPLHLGPGVEDEAGIRGVGRGEDGQIVLHRDAAVPGQHLQGDLVRPVVVGHIPEKARGHQRHRRRR